MKTGKMNKRASFQVRLSGVADAYGEQNTKWSEAGTRWVELRPLSAKSVQFAKGFKDTVSHTIILRQWDDLTTNYRVVIGGRNFYVDGVVQSPDFRMTTLYCTEEA